MPDPGRVIRIAELLTEKPLLAIGINREKMDSKDIKRAKKELEKKYEVPVVEPLSEGVDEIIDAMIDIHDK